MVRQMRGWPYRIVAGVMALVLFVAGLQALRSARDTEPPQGDDRNTHINEGAIEELYEACGEDLEKCVISEWTVVAGDD